VCPPGHKWLGVRETAKAFSGTAADMARKENIRGSVPAINAAAGCSGSHTLDSKFKVGSLHLTNLDCKGARCAKKFGFSCTEYRDFKVFVKGYGNNFELRSVSGYDRCLLNTNSKNGDIVVTTKGRKVWAEAIMQFNGFNEIGPLLVPVEGGYRAHTWKIWGEGLQTSCSQSARNRGVCRNLMKEALDTVVHKHAPPR